MQTTSGGLPVGGDVAVITASNATVSSHIVLRHSSKPDTETQGRGVPELPRAGGHFAGRQPGLGALEAGQRAARRGSRRPGSRLPEHGPRNQLAHRLGTLTEDYAARIDHDNAGVASTAPFDPTVPTCSWRSRPAARSRSSMHTAASSCSASTSAVRRRVSPSRTTAHALRQQFHGSHGQRFRSSAAGAAGRDGAAGRHDGQRHFERSALAEGAAGKQLFYDARDPRLARDALPELRDLPQRRRSRRPRLGSDRLRRGTAQHHQFARPRRRPGLPALVQQLRRGAGLRRPDPPLSGARA